MISNSLIFLSITSEEGGGACDIGCLSAGHDIFTLFCFGGSINIIYLLIDTKYKITL